MLHKSWIFVWFCTWEFLISAILDIPIYKSRIQSLHLLFSLYSEFKNSQHFKALAEGKKAFTPPSNSTSQAGDAETLTFSWDTSQVTLFQGWAGFSIPAEKKRLLAATWRPCLWHSLSYYLTFSARKHCTCLLHGFCLSWFSSHGNCASLPLGTWIRRIGFLGCQDAQLRRKL